MDIGMQEEVAHVLHIHIRLSQTLYSTRVLICYFVILKTGIALNKRNPLYLTNKLQNAGAFKKKVLKCLGIILQDHLTQQKISLAYQKFKTRATLAWHNTSIDCNSFIYILPTRFPY